MWGGGAGPRGLPAARGRRETHASARRSARAACIRQGAWGGRLVCWVWICLWACYGGEWDGNQGV